MPCEPAGRRPRPVYPFAALVGQERMQRALLANAVCPDIGGVLLRGEKGTAKSTAVRGLAAVLPEIEVAAGCACGCAPEGPYCPGCQENLARGRKMAVERRPIRVVDLPLGATEDRLAGGLDLEAAVRQGVRAFSPGLLAAANRGVLYVDEVNLLPDHLVDLVLDAAASGVNVVEREGVSLAHPARFILVGSMNPEEGELRPQLLDRFGLCVEVAAPREPDARLAVLRAREAYDLAPDFFRAAHEPGQKRLAHALAAARSRLPRTAMPEELSRLCSELAREANVAGHRADLALRRAALALAALDGLPAATEALVREAAALALLHRMRTAPPPPPPQPEEQPKQEERPQDQDQQEQEDQEHQHQPQRREARAGEGESGQGEESRPEESDAEPEEASRPGPDMEAVFPVGDPFRIKPVGRLRDREVRTGSGRRTRARTAGKSGRYVKSRLDPRPDDLALDATLRAAAPFQRCREKHGLAVAVRDADLRRKVREKRVGNVVVLVVDASGSMGAQRRMVECKAAALSLLLDAYQKRDKVALVAFRKEGAEVLLPPTSSVDLAHTLLEELPTGGRTPLAHGLAKGWQLIDLELRKNPRAVPLLVVVSDGRANVALAGGKPLDEARRMAEHIRDDGRAQCVLVDVERPGPTSFGLARALAESMDARYFRIEDLRAETLVAALRQGGYSGT